MTRSGCKRHWLCRFWRLNPVVCSGRLSLLAHLADCRDRDMRSKDSDSSHPDCRQIDIRPAIISPVRTHVILPGWSRWVSLVVMVEVGGASKEAVVVGWSSGQMSGYTRAPSCLADRTAGLSRCPLTLRSSGSALFTAHWARLGSLLSNAESRWLRSAHDKCDIVSKLKVKLWAIKLTRLPVKCSSLGQGRTW